MALPTSCCTPCATPETVNIPGVEGAAGTNGTDGLNACTTTTTNTTIPAIGADVTVDVVTNAMLAIGQVVVIDGPANFSVKSKPAGGASVVLTFLGYTGDLAPAVVITAGATLCPTGMRGISPTVLPTLSDYERALSQALTDSTAQIGTASVTLPDAGHYLMYSFARLDFVATTLAAAVTAELKLYDSTNAADVPDAITALDTGVRSNESGTFWAGNLPAVDFNLASAPANVEMRGVLSAAIADGSLDAVEVGILAVPVV